MFPASFLFGTATSATQVEGGAETDWAAFARETGRVHGADTPDVACDHWHRWREDVALQASLGMNAHRMSIEWARVEPRPGEWAHDAIDRYRAELGALRDAGIAPMVTLHHFSIPTWMRDRGGLEADTLAERLAAYAREMIRALGDLCTMWITINEPNVLAAQSYLLGVWPPGVKRPLSAMRAHHRLLEAHVAMYRALHDADRGGAKVGVAHHLRVVEPASASRADRFAATVLRRIFNEPFAQALCEGTMTGPLDRIRNRRGFRVVDAKGTQDFFGLNYYSRDLVRFSRAHAAEMFVARGIADGAETSDLGWEIHPAGLGALLRTWGRRSGLPIYVTENGIADRADTKRPRFLVDHLREVARAIADGIDVRGYYHWSLLDNFEWAEGYAPRFGLVEVDYATQTRRIRASGKLYAKIARARTLDVEGFSESAAAR